MRARLKLKEAENKRLQQKLQHLRTWMGCVHARVQQMNPNAIKNAKRLYIGNLIPGTTEVGRMQNWSWVGRLWARQES